MRAIMTAELRRVWNTCLWSWQGWTAAWASEKTLRQWTIVNALSVGLSFWVDMSPAERAVIWGFGLLILAGLLGGVGQILLTTSYRNTDASLIAPFEYTSMILSIMVGYTIFGEVPGAATLAGGAMIVIAGILIILRERQLGLKRTQQRKAGPTNPH